MEVLSLLKNVDLKINSTDIKVIVPILTGILSFIVYWFFTQSKKWESKLANIFFKDQSNASFIVITRLFGGTIMGAVPFVSYLLFFPDTKLKELGFAFDIDHLNAILGWTFVLIILVVPLVWMSSRKEKNQQQYPQIRTANWNTKLVSASLLSWAVYLLGYEFYFRGLLLFPLKDSLGLWPAIAVNIGLYSATHIPKGLNEAIMTIPFAIILSILTLETESIWIAYFVHVAMAWSNNIFSLKYHPEMKFSR